jgi:hypothetical protein
LRWLLTKRTGVRFCISSPTELNPPKHRKKDQMDIQKLLDVVSNTARQERKNYHLTLGGLIAELEKVPADTQVVIDRGGRLHEPHSYRGYYSDLAFHTGDGATSAGELLAVCRGALGSVYEGYKGGDFTMDDDTPLWISSYGSASGVAVVSASMFADKLLIGTKQVDR